MIDHPPGSDRDPACARSTAGASVYLGSTARHLQPIMADQGGSVIFAVSKSARDVFYAILCEVP